MSVVVLGIAILVLLMLRVPVAFALLGPCLAYMVLTDASPGLSVRTALDGVDSWPLLAIPLFVLVGVIANRAGVADRLFDAALATMGRVRGSLGYVNIGVSLGFSWMSGSALADAAGLGAIEVPAMVKKGYPARFSVGITASSAVIGPIMPPSIPAVVYASVAAVSTGALFAASVVPALLLAGTLAVTVFLWTLSRPELRGEAFEWRRFGSTTLRALPALGAPIVILGGILGGVFTPTEAAGVGALYMFVLGFVYGTLRVADLRDIFRDTAVTTASITIILGASALLGWIFAREQVPQTVATAMLGFTDNPFVFLIMVNVVLLLLGMVIEPTSALVISVPILLPIAVEFGVDPVQFGVLTVLNLMIGLLTPPVGPLLYVLSSVTEMSVKDVVRGTGVFFVPLVAVLLTVTFVPAVALWLPRTLGL